MMMVVVKANVMVSYLRIETDGTPLMVTSPPCVEIFHAREPLDGG